MTFNQLIRWICTKPDGRIEISADIPRRMVRFDLQCRAPKGDPPPVVNLTRLIDLREVYFRRDEKLIETWIGEQFDDFKREFEELYP